MRLRQYEVRLRKSGDVISSSRPLPDLFHQHATIGLMSGEAARFPDRNTLEGHETLGRYMDMKGMKYIATRGRYGAPERSYIVLSPTLEQMKHLGERFGQESVIFSKGPSDHKIVYTRGEHAGKYQPFKGMYETFDTEPDNDYTYIPHYGFLRLHFDWNAAPLKFDPAGDTATHIPAPTTSTVEGAGMEGVSPEHAPGDADDRAGAPDIEHTDKLDKTDPATRLARLRARRAPLEEYAQPHTPHPHAYEWHDGHTDHHFVSPVLRKDLQQHLQQHLQQEHPHASGPPQENPHLGNDQVAGAGAKTYAKFAAPYGTIKPGTKTNLLFYPYHGKADAAKKLVADNGFTSYYAGGKYGKPDLAQRNYNTKHLMVYDPSPDSGGSFQDQGYTDAWRHVHELAHAITYPQLNSMYGEGRRIGKLGVHRTLREAQRAVHWEWLAAHKQRELSAQMGVHIPDESFNRELNTVMHDAIHRAVTGKFTEPSDEGFTPHAHKVPLEHALNTVASEARRLGLADHNSLVTRKSEGEHTLSEKITITTEQRQKLAKALKSKLDAYKAHLDDLRQRELRKSATPAPAGDTFQVTVPDLANCPKCGQPDAPGSCTCLSKGEGKTALFSGTENNGKKQPSLFSGAKKGANPLGKEEKSAALFNGADKSGKKQPSLFDRAKGGEDVLKDEPNMSLFSGSENDSSDPELFRGAKKGACALEPQKGAALGKEEKPAEGPKCSSCGKPFKNPVDAMVGSKHNVCGDCAKKNHAAVVQKSESPIFKAMAAKNLCPTCQKSHQGPRCSGDPKVVKGEDQGVLPSDKKSKVIDTAEGSGGNIAKGKGLKKDQPPMAKPPSGKNPAATPTSKPGAAPGMAQPAKPGTPATGAAPIAKGDFGMGDNGRVATTPAQAAPSSALAGGPAPKKDASQIRGTPAHKIALPGAHLFNKKPAAAAVAPTPAPALPATGTK